MTGSFTTVSESDIPGVGSLVVASTPVTGGTMYFSYIKNAPANTQGGQGTFVPTAAGGLQRFLALTNAKSDTGVGLTASATGGAMGISRTAGTSLVLVGEATSSSAKTDKALFELDLPESYVGGSNIVVDVNCQVTGSGTLTGASTSITLNAYTENNGAEAALTVSAAQLFTATQADLDFTITGTGLVPGSHVVIELVVLVTSASGANTGQVNSVSFVA